MTSVFAAACVGGLSTRARAQDGPRPDELRRMYDAALEQLKTAQDRKNELATANAELTRKLAEVQQKLDQQVARLATLERQHSDAAAQTFYLRATYGALQTFLARYPMIAQRWEKFLAGDPLAAGGAGGEAATFYDPAWPLSAMAR